MRSLREVYLDHNATTPIAPEAARAIRECLEDHFANPSSVHRPGQEARHRLEEARETLASIIGAQPQEIFFTSGATESNNLAIQGAARIMKAQGKRHLVTTAFEHPSVLGPFRYLEDSGEFRITVVGVTPEGLVRPAEILEALRPDTGFVSVMHVNHEVGTIQPIGEIAGMLKERGILFHTDLSQSFGKVPFSVDEIACDFASFSAHKIYGPKGMGALYVRGRSPLAPLFYGGHQEKNVRPGTENVAFAVGLAEAAKFMEKVRAKDAGRLFLLKKKFLQGLEENIQGVSVNGPVEKTVYTTLNVAFEDVDGEALLTNLDLEGIHAATGSACTAGSLEPSHVLLAMGIPEALARSSIRFSLGHGTSEEDILYCIERISSTVTFLRTGVSGPGSGLYI